MSFIHLIISEHDSDHKLKNSTLKTLAAAQRIEGTYYGLVIGKKTQHVAIEFSKYVSCVYFVENEILEYNSPQLYSKIIAEIAGLINATHIWSAATSNGKDIMPRVAVRLEAAMASDVCQIIDSKNFKRMMFAGDVIASIELKTNFKIITIRQTEFNEKDLKKTSNGEIIKFESKNLHRNNDIQHIRTEKNLSKRPDLADAKIIVSGGRGLKNFEGFKDIIESLADRLQAAIGASRAACDAGWASNDLQIGQTGKIVAPKLYFAIGISGAMQHIAGMKGSEIIVAINKDPEAPIFKIANYGIIGDAFLIVPEFLKKLRDVINK